MNFNPRPSYEGRLPTLAMIAPFALISIHAPHTRGDIKGRYGNGTTRKFQSTPLIRGATLTPIT